MRRRQFLAGLAACGVAGAAGCVSDRDDESAVVQVRNWRSSPIRARLSVTPATPGTRACRAPETTPTGEPVTVDPDGLVAVTSVEPGAYKTVFHGGGHETTWCLQHDGDRSAYTFVVDSQVTFVTQ